MPYIKGTQRKMLDVSFDPQDAGELNYCITKLCDKYLQTAPQYASHGPKYADFNTIIGVLESAKLEFYRRLVAKYEDQKKAENGDVYTARESAREKDEVQVVQAPVPEVYAGYWPLGPV